MKNIIIGVIVAIVVIGGFLWYQKSEAPTLIGDPIKIGGAFGLTGFAAEWGEAEKNGVTLAIEEINKNGGVNGRPLVLVSEDIASDPTKAVTAVSKLISIDGVPIVIGPTWLDSYQGAAPLADQHEIFMISPSASITAVQGYGDSGKFKNVFSTWYRTDHESEQLLAHLQKKGYRNVVLFFQQEPFWDDFSSFLKSRTATYGLTIVDEFHFNPQETDFRTFLQRVKAKNPDAIIFGSNNEKANLSFLKQRQTLYPASRLYTTEWIEELTRRDDYKGLLNQVSFITPQVADGTFAATYKKRFGRDPVFSATNAYDAMSIVGEAIATNADDPEEIAAYLRSHEFNTVSFGTARFDGLGGVTTGQFVIKGVDANNVVNVQ